MPADERARCLWHAEDGRCSSCKARRVRADVLKLQNYDVCHPERDYRDCEFYRERPAVPRER